MAQMRCFAVKNQQASLLKRRKYELVRRFGLPEDALGGHLAMTYRRCGKPTCHCIDGRGHPRWSLTYSFEGKKRTELLSDEQAAELAPLVEQGRELRDAVMELSTATCSYCGCGENSSATGRHQQRNAGPPPRATSTRTVADPARQLTA